MTDSVGGEGSNGGGSGSLGRWRRWLLVPEGLFVIRWLHGARRGEELAQARWAAALDQARAANAHARAYDHARTYARLRAYISVAVKASGLVALLLSTVILLGGYVQLLEKRDFFCIMAITVIQAAGIFQDWENNTQYFKDSGETIKVLTHNINYQSMKSSVNDFLGKKSTVKDFLYIWLVQPVLVVFMGLLWCALVLYVVGPLACAGISSWRIAKLNHGNTNRDANMKAALNIFYSLIIFQGTAFGALLCTVTMGEMLIANHLLAREQLSDTKWGKEAIRGYISDISKKCRKDPVSIKGMDLIKYGAELLDSESQEDYLYGARLLSAFVNKGEDVSWVLLPSRHRIQRLIDSLMISSSSSSYGGYYAVIGSGLEDAKEIRELAATMVAHVAAHIDDLSKYSGAMRCISSLLQHQGENTQNYRHRDSKHPPDDPALHQRLTKWEQYAEEIMQKVIEKEERPRRDLMKDQKRLVDREHRHRPKNEGGTSNKLVQQGLTILERLASNSNGNRRIICCAPGLLPKITAPLYSATLIEDIKTKAWADIVTRCFKVLYQLIRAPAGWTSRRLRHEISSDDQALSNLKSILLDQQDNDEAGHQELKLIAMKILTELALDRSINLTKETKKVLVTKQLQLFLFANGDDDEESAIIAGRAMVSLSCNSSLIKSAQAGRRLTGILDKADDQEPQLVTITELSCDLSVNLTDDIKKVLITNQLQLFLLANGEDEEESATIAGRAMVSLSTNSKTNSLLIMTTQDDIISRLTGILDDVLITRRTIAAEIMANLCAHCEVDNNMKEILLPKVLREIMSIKIKSKQRNVSAGQNASGDEENQGNYMSINNEERHNTSRVLRLLRRCLGLGVPQQSPKGIEEISDEEREEQEAFLSLAQVTCDKLDSADLDGAIQKAIDQNNAGSEEQRREAFVDKLKTIIDDNCHPAADSLRDPAADSLRIVKLCGRIAKSVVGCEQYKEIFRNRGFKSSLSKASETMSELESCMLFVGTDFGLKKTVRPLFSEIERSFGQI